MPWDDAPQLESKLRYALDSFNWSEVEALCAEIIERIKKDPDPLPERSGKTFLQDLRRKRRFALMSSLGDALLQSGVRGVQIRRQYAQALIDQGQLTMPEMLLQSVIQDSGGKNEELEARGLIGRLYKQLFVNNNDASSPRNRANLQRALDEYFSVYERHRDKLWHGINVLALVDRARRDNIPLTGAPDSAALAREILATLAAQEEETTDAIPAWDVAIELEAHVALGDHRSSADAAFRYIDSPGADAFEIASTLRQLTEVWQLNERAAPGSHVLPILKAGRLRKEGVVTGGAAKTIREEAAAVQNSIEGLEALFGDTRTLPLKWYKKGLDQCNSIARIQKLNGQGHGTGWLVKASDFFPARDGLLLLTNAHVVSDYPNPFTNPKAVYPEDARIRFETLGDELYEVEDEIVWTSPPSELDATFLALKSVPASAAPLTIHMRAVDWVTPAPRPRFYIIGHPGGRDLEIALQDNHLLAYNETFLHYRTPTEPGNSGSPVFEPADWRVVGLHHRGSEAMPRLDGEPGTYEANEGIAILAIRNATRGASATITGGTS